MNSIFIEKIVSVIISVVTVVATVSIGIMQIKQNKKIDEREKNRQKQWIDAEAKKFILKYSSPNYNMEIYLLPLCVIRYKYNPLYPYHREIYREFCSLTDDIRNSILLQQNIDITLSKCDNFYDKMLNFLLLDIEESYPCNRDLYYDGGKYFESALLNHGAEQIPYIECPSDKYYIEALDCIPNNKNKSTMEYKNHIANLLANEKNLKPISRLMNEANMMSNSFANNEILISYLNCYVAKYVSCYSHSQDIYKYENLGCVENFQGTLYMEDLFLNALFHIFIFH